jgi:hypothetical protein
LWFAAAVLGGCGLDAPTSDSEASSALDGSPSGEAVVLSRDSRGLQVIRSAQGIMVRLGTSFQNAAVVRRAADGTLQTECFDTDSQVQAFKSVTPTTAHRRLEDR